MYPIGLKVHGIRDFLPVELDLGGKDEHVLIGGKNGSGKSTLVYATSFALVSGRVSIDGLRSKTIKKDEHWHSKVSVLFHNPPGPEQKDAPEYVELSAEIRSRAGTESRQVIYSMSGGAARDMLAPIKRFSSRQEAHDYYKRVFSIDPEGYFMFWYQGSITEFANISDSARFERVAEMFGIDRIREEWEEARAAMLEAENDFLRAKNFALMQQRRLQEFEKQKNALESRDNLRAEGLILYEVCYREIKRLLGRELEQISMKLAEKESSIKEWQKRHEDALKRLRDIENEKVKQQEILKTAQDEYAAASSEHSELRRRIEAYDSERRELESKVKDIQNKLKYIRRSKEELQEDKGRVKAEIDHLNGEIKGAEKMLGALELEKSGLNEKMGRARLRLEQVTGKIEEYIKLDKELPNAAHLEEREAEIKAQKDRCGVDILRLENEIQSLKGREAFLKSCGSPLLAEQVEILDMLKQRNITCAAFGELFDMAGCDGFDAVEELLATLKHVIFTESLPDDVIIEAPFYVVDLESTCSVAGNAAPAAAEKSLLDFVRFSDGAAEKYGDRFLRRVREWASRVAVVDRGDERLNELLAGCQGNLAIHRNMLWDGHGVRGPFDKNPAIGKQALERALEKTRHAVSEQEKLREKLEKQKKALGVMLSKLQRELALRLEVDRELPAALEERGKLGYEIDRLGHDLENKVGEIEALRKELDARKKDLAARENMLKQIEGELSVYAEYEREYESVLRIQELESLIDGMENKKAGLDKKLRILQETTDEARRNLKNLDGELLTLGTQAELTEKKLNSLEDEKKALEDKKATVEIEQEERDRDYERLCMDYGPVIEGLKSTGRWVIRDLEEKEKNRTNLERKLAEARNKLDEASQRAVDEDARRKYEDFLVEYNMAKNEMEESELRFMSLKKKEEEKRSEYDRAVYYRWQRTNQRFSSFMERLHMVGSIVSVPPDDEGKNKGYRWELHVATKLGHKPEKIFPETGKIVGEGISGGERAAVSLVFALALLSDIEDRPPFYVLDEFDSALDEEKKHEIFDLYRQVLGRKLIIVSPKVHGDRYLDRFSKFLCVVANPGILPNRTVSEVYEVTREGYKEADLED